MASLGLVDDLLKQLKVVYVVLVLAQVIELLLNLCLVYIPVRLSIILMWTG